MPSSRREKNRESQKRWAAKRLAADPEAWRKYCRERQAEWSARQPKEKRKDYLLKYMYGLAPGAYAEMLAAQGGACAICMTPSRGERRLIVDHDHSTGAVRDLLCVNCNSIIGYAKDNPERLRRCAEYVERHRPRLEAV